MTVAFSEPRSKVDALSSAAEPLLRVEDLRVVFPTPERPVEAVRGISFSIDAGQIQAATCSSPTRPVRPSGGSR